MWNLEKNTLLPLLLPVGFTLMSVISEWGTHITSAWAPFISVKTKGSKQRKGTEKKKKKKDSPPNLKSTNVNRVGQAVHFWLNECMWPCVQPSMQKHAAARSNKVFPLSVGIHLCAPPPGCRSASLLSGTRLVVCCFVPSSLCAGSCAGSLLSACEIAALAPMAPLINHPVRLFIISRHLGCRWLLSPWHRVLYQEEA